ncbi:MAG TPA: hypothetical protein VD736_09525 [Nitrososphaera sp.]|nr:hypothetical protein [Nitrososphaera sp.]
MSEGGTTAIKKPSMAWYLLPILLSIVGGLIMYFALRNRDPKMARNGLILGAILTVAGIAISMAAGMAGLSSFS